MFKVMSLKVAAFAALVSLTLPAQADKIIQPGEVVKVGSERIYCAGDSNSDSQTYSCECITQGGGSGSRRYTVGRVKVQLTAPQQSEWEVIHKAKKLCMNMASNLYEQAYMNAGACQAL